MLLDPECPAVHLHHHAEVDIKGRGVCRNGIIKGILDVPAGIFGIFRRSTFSRKNIAKLIDDSLFDHTVLKEHDIDQYAEPFTNPDVRSGVQRTVMAFDEEDILDKLRSVDSEVLLLWGDKDNWRPIDMKDTYLAVLRHANLMIVRNSGHIPQEERPDRVCEMVFDFIPAGYDVEG